MNTETSIRPKGISALIVLFILIGSNLQVVAQDSLLQAGPMIGYVEMMEANIWVQTTESARVQIRYRDSRDQEYKLSTVARTNRNNSYIAQIKLRDLEPGTEFSYQVLLNGNPVDRPYPTRFKTQELWQWRTDPPSFKMAIGSCLYINDPKYDRPGEPYGGSTDILRVINRQNPDIMLWLGDNVYYREADFYSYSRLDYRNRDARKIDAMQPLLGSTVNLAIWDDHDYGPNNSDRSYRMKEEALKLFKRYWINPGYGTNNTKGIFTRYKYADTEMFLMDDRYHRAPNQLEDSSKAYFGEEQLQWLKDALVNSNATFKLIASGNQMTNVNGGHESFTNYPAEFHSLMHFIKKQQIEGVVFLTGDRHFTELLKTERSGSYPLYEFTSSPLSSGTYSDIENSEEFNNPLRVDGTIIYEKRNFGMVEVTGPRGDRTLILSGYTAEGQKRWEHEIHEDELTVD